MAHLKKCCRCKDDKPVTEFHKNKRTKDGFQRACKSCCADRHRQFRYQLTPEEFDTLFKKQKGLCAICHLPPRGIRGLAVDHDHETGAVRGLLCLSCNRALGYFENNSWANDAARYLKEHHASFAL